MSKILFILLLASPCLYADALSDIVGPVIAYGASPWPWYDLAEKGNADQISTAALSNTPDTRLGVAASCTFQINSNCNVQLIGSCAGEFSSTETAIVAWNSPGGTGTGRFIVPIASVTGTTITSSGICGLPPGMSADSGLTVYHCDNACVVDANGKYDPAWWGFNGGAGSASWNYYDMTIALYRMYLRTGNATYLTYFRNLADEWWTWAVNSGSVIMVPPRQYSIVGQFVRALDGHQERLNNLYLSIKNRYDFNNLTHVDGEDNREPGYMLMFAAVGVKADTDTVRHAFYCAAISSFTLEWVNTQTAQGYWTEKNNQYPYALPGESPWRIFAANQGLARAYDAMNDSSSAGCNNPTRASQVLSTLKSSADFVYNFGYTPTNRGVFYDAQYPNDGQDGFGNGVQAGTVTVTLNSTSVVGGGGTTFTTTFSPCNGSTWIGINLSGQSWTHKVTACADDTHLTIATAWGTQCTTAYNGQVCAASDAVSQQYYETANSSTTCNNSASNCWDNLGTTGGLLNGDRNNDRDAIWIMGWLFKTTHNIIYKQRGDELFSASYGGPAAGPGANCASPGPCGGPACDGVETDYIQALHGCGSDPTTPCNCGTNFTNPSNVYHYQAKRFAQGSGIGGADNYLAWRLGTSDAFTGGVILNGGVTIQ